MQGKDMILALHFFTCAALMSRISLGLKRGLARAGTLRLPGRFRRSAGNADATSVAVPGSSPTRPAPAIRCQSSCEWKLTSAHVQHNGAC